MIEPPIPMSFIEGRGKDFLLFTYDVYMDIVRLHRYMPNAREPKIMQLPNYKLVFPLWFAPAGSGLPTIVRSPGDEIWGIGWRTPIAELPKFEAKLSAPNRYHLMDIRVKNRAGDVLPAKTYSITIPQDPQSKPSAAKLREIMELGKTVGLPNEYLAKLGATETL